MVRWWLSNESGWLVKNRKVFLFGTEAPENAEAVFENSYGYGDVPMHHNYYNGTFPGNCLDDSASVRAQEEYHKALLCLRNGSYALAAWYSGAMCHYISDLGSWPHVIGNATPSHASKYEELLNSVTDDYNKDPGYVDLDPAGPSNADGSILSAETAYNAALWLGIGIYSDGGGWHHVGQYPAVVMDSPFQGNWSNVADLPRMYRMRIGYSIRATVLAVADALHALTIESGFTTRQAPSLPLAEIIVLVSVSGFGAAVVIVASAHFRHKKLERQKGH